MNFHRLKNVARSRVSRLLFERRLDVQTSGRIELDELGVASEDCWRYEPAEWRVLPRIVRRREIGPDDVFLDFGAGMGRVVLQAAQYEPRQVIGVELAEELTEIARDNVERNRHRLKCQDIQLHTANALEYELPDDVTIAFFNNPFTGEVFSGVLDKIIVSLENSPRPLRIIYRNPREHEAVVATGRFRLARKWQRGAWRGRPRGVAIHLYESISAV